MSTTASKNQLVWARCHLMGLASGIDWMHWSSAESGAARATLCSRTWAKRWPHGAADAAGAVPAATDGNAGMPKAPGVGAQPRHRPDAGLLDLSKPLWIYY